MNKSKSLLSVILALEVIFGSSRLIQKVSGQEIRLTQAGETQNFSLSKIKQIEVVGSSIFSKQDLSPIISKFIGTSANIENLLELRAAITRLYTEKGYSTSAAFIPQEQDISQGIVKIQVVEGKLEEIIIEGLERLNKSYIIERLQLSVPLNIYELQEALQILQTDPLFKEVNAELATGTAPGLTILKVKVTEADSFTLQLGTDNNRTPSVGSERGGFLVSQGNLWGNGEQIEGSYFYSEGSHSVFLGLTLPLNSSDATLRVESGLTFNEIVERPFNLLDLETESRYYQLSVRQPVIKNPFQELALGITITRIESETFLDGERFPLSRGANVRGETRISSVRFFQEWLTRNQEEILSLRSQFSLGVNLDPISGLEPDSEFFHWNFQGQYIRQLAPDTLLILRGQVQQADQPLLPDEQFRLGGFDSVRGYRQDLIVSDNGFYASVEVRVPVVRIPEWNAVVQIAPFVDYGHGWNNGEFPLEPSSLTSVGLGLRWQQRDFSANVYWGIPLTTVKEEKRTLQENGLYFNLRWNAF